jgi:hypothetical protein
MGIWSCDMTEAKQDDGPSPKEGHRLIEAFRKICDAERRAALIAAAERLGVQDQHSPGA